MNNNQNIKFTAYSKTTGQILYSGTASDPTYLEKDSIAIFVGEIFENGWIDDGKHYFLPDKPSEHHIFDYTTKQWIDPRTPETEWSLVRAKRNQLLSASDWTQLPDVPLTTKAEWATYRQALRDITNQTDPFNIIWPTPPN